MTFDQWFQIERPQPLTADNRAQLMAVCDAVHDDLVDPVAPATPNPDDIFDSLCRYCRARYSYTFDGRGITRALNEQSFNCAAAADFVVGVMLQLTGADLVVERFTQVFAGGRPTITPPVHAAGVRIDGNLTGAGARMFFSGSHYVATVSDDQYDLISGMRSHRIAFIQAFRGDDVGGQPSFTAQVDGAQRTLTKLPGQTAQGLSLFSVTPALQ